MNGSAQRLRWSEGAEAEGFEPPVHLSTLAFKVLATPFRTIREMRYRWSQTGGDLARTAVNGDE